VVSVYYYLRVAYVMFTGQPMAELQIHRSPLVVLALALAALVVIQTGVLPGAMAVLAQAAGAVAR
jgi:NADH:ubiquinone oxidoreductase subunit 2 (subunit N)